MPQKCQIVSFHIHILLNEKKIKNKKRGKTLILNNKISYNKQL